MKTSDKLISVELDDLAFLIICAGRYCTGRKSIAPHILQSIVRKYWDNLLVDPGDIGCKDLTRCFEDVQKWYPGLRDDYSYKEWYAFIAELVPIAYMIDKEAEKEACIGDPRGINVILGMLLRKDLIAPSQCEVTATFIKDKLHSEKMWIGDNDYEAEKFISLYWDELASYLHI